MQATCLFLCLRIIIFPPQRLETYDPKCDSWIFPCILHFIFIIYKCFSPKKD